MSSRGERLRVAEELLMRARHIIKESPAVANGPAIRQLVWLHDVEKLPAALEGERDGGGPFAGINILTDERVPDGCVGILHDGELEVFRLSDGEKVASDDAPERDRAVESSPTPEADKWHKTDPSKPGNRELDVCGDYCGAHHIGGTTWRFGSGDDCADPAYGTATLDGIREARFVVAAIDNAVRESCRVAATRADHQEDTTATPVAQEER